VSDPSIPDPSRADARVGTTLADRYRIDALVGEGGMGRVYAAEHVLMRKRLAVKVLHRELTTMPEVVARFEREAMAAANIDHPNVAAATDFGKLSDGAVFLVLEYVQGKSLRDEIAKGPIAADRALHITRQIAAGLGSAHALDIVHRDLKPENVMLVEKGGDPDFVKVLDFGIAKVPVAELPQLPASTANTPITKAGMVFGTPEYMSPEQALGQTVDGRSDLYALGVILYEMLCGSRPFSSQSQLGILGQQLSKPPPPIAERAPGIVVPPAVEQLAMKLLQREASARCQTAAEVVEACNGLLAPIPGQGIYRFTLSDGSPPGSAVSSTTTPVSAREVLGPGPLPVIVPVVAPPPDAARDAGETRARGVDLQAQLDDRLASLRAKLPLGLKQRVEHVPTRVLFGVAGVLSLVMLLLLGVIVSLFTGPKREPEIQQVASSAAAASSPAVAPAVPDAAEHAPESELARARSGGTGELESLLEKFPRDPKIAVELARLYLGQKNYTGAVGAVGRALSIDAAQQNDPQLASVVFQTAQVKVSSDASFALLEGAMGTRGADIAYDLVTTPNVRPWVQKRAETFLQSAAFEKVASPGLRAIVRLRYSAGCDEKLSLLQGIEQDADERALFELVPLQDRSGCGARKKDDCYPCLRQSSGLDDAIAAVRARKR
jgi:serine/threonine-protein kinase